MLDPRIGFRPRFDFLHAIVTFDLKETENSFLNVETAGLWDIFRIGSPQNPSLKNFTSVAFVGIVVFSLHWVMQMIMD